MCPMPSFVDPQRAQALPEPPPLGFPVPAHRHAVSVQLPTWRDMQDMVAQTPRVASVQQIGYPRSFLNQHVTKVHEACETLFGKPGEKCLVYPALDHALACKDMLSKLVNESADHSRIRAADFLVDESSTTSIGSAAGPALARRRFFLVLYPGQFNSSAMIFWRLTGTGISSRLAESLHEGLSSILVATVEDRSADAILFREMCNQQADAIVRSRIADLLRRASIRPERSKRFSAQHVYLYPTGMAAIYAANKLLQAWRGEQTVVFGFPYELTLKLVQTYGVDAKFYGFGTSTELDEFESYLASERLQGRRVQSVWCECASNPLLRTVDFQRIRQLADEYGFLVVVDETIGSFANVDVAGIADVIVTSLTKSFSGNANVMAGSIVLDPESAAFPRLTEILDATYVNELFGADSLVLEHNCRKFLPRAAIMNRNASFLVDKLACLAGQSSSALTHVYYPTTCWSRANYEARMRDATPDFTPGYGGLFTMEFESVATASTFFNSLNVHKGPSLGAPVTLAQPYVQTVFSKDKEWAASYGLSETIVRISVGLEEKQALATEFERALRVAHKFKAGRECVGYFESVL